MNKLCIKRDSSRLVRLVVQPDENTRTLNPDPDTEDRATPLVKVSEIRQQHEDSIPLTSRRGLQ